MLGKRVTVVTTPASSYDLTDLATVRDELKIINDTSDDAFLSRAITQASTAIANYCNRVFPVETLQDTFYPDPIYPAQGPLVGDSLQLARWPLAAVTSVTVQHWDSTTVTLTEGVDFIQDAAVGGLVRLRAGTGFPCVWWRAVTTVVYQAGYPTIPADLVAAVLSVVTQRFQERGRDPFLKSQEQPGMGMQTYWIGARPGYQGAFSDETLRMLDTYRVPGIG
jgi:hypothetical protein